MMRQYKGYVFRLYPNDIQKDLINKSLGVSRFIYNYFLEFKKKEYEENNKKYSCYDLIKMIPSLNITYPFLKEVDSCLLRCSIFDLDNAFNNFYKGKGYPNFKKKGIKDSYKTNNMVSSYKGKTYNSIELDLLNKTIKLPKLVRIDIRGYRKINKINGSIKSAVIRKIGYKYYVSILVEEEISIPVITPQTIIGIDLGIKDMVVASNGLKLDNPNKERIERLRKRLKGLNKALSRSQKGSNNRYKLIMKIQRINQKINNIKRHIINNISNIIVKENDIISVEDLDIKNMYQEKRIARKLIDIPLYKLIETIKWKAYLLGKKVIQINRYYASSQECSVCGNKNEEVKDLSIRKWECKECHNVHDRDINASINIMFEGLKKYMKEEYE